MHLRAQQEHTVPSFLEHLLISSAGCGKTVLPMAVEHFYFINEIEHFIISWIYRTVYHKLYCRPKIFRTTILTKYKTSETPKIDNIFIFIYKYKNKNVIDLWRFTCLVYCCIIFVNLNIISSVVYSISNPIFNIYFYN